MAVLVTGATGFVGSNIVSHLAQNGEDVIAFDLSPPDQITRWLLQRYPDRVTVVPGDVCDLALLEGLVADHNIDRIVHGAAITPRGVELERERCQAIAEAHLLGTVNIFQAARSIPDLHRVINISSGAVYGSSQGAGPLTEDQPVIPQNLYAITKYAGELLGRRWGQLFDLDIVSVRLSSVYGPMERVTPSRRRMSQMYTLVRLAMEGKTIKVNSLAAWSGWVHAWDVARAVADLLQAPSLRYGVYNISAGVIYSLGEVLAALAACVPDMRYSVVAEENANVYVRPGRRGQPMDVRRLREELDFEFQYPLAEGLKQYVRWLSEGNP